MKAKVLADCDLPGMIHIETETPEESLILRSFANWSHIGGRKPASLVLNLNYGSNLDEVSGSFCRGELLEANTEVSGTALAGPGPDFREIMLEHIKEQNRRLAALEQAMGKLTYIVQQLQMKPPEPEA